jgi:hypothetical protein
MNWASPGAMSAVNDIDYTMAGLYWSPSPRPVFAVATMVVDWIAERAG